MATKPKFKWGLAGKIVTDPAELDVQTIVSPAVTLFALPVDGSAFDPPKFIIGDKAGTATVGDARGGSVANFRITGQEQHVALTSIGSLSTTTKV